MHDPIFLIMVVLTVVLLLVCFHIPATGFRDPVACMSPLTSRAVRGRFVPIPTLEVVVSTKRLAVPISRFEVRWRFESNLKELASNLFARIVAFLTSKMPSGV
jgi:hypothetical protein